MTKVIPLPSPCAGLSVQLPTQTQSVSVFAGNTIERQQAIENALSMALYHIRHGDSIQAIRTATAKATRAASLLKHACECATNHAARV
jgi:hypothetical protein